jgi:hypothetical protein
MEGYSAPPPSLSTPSTNSSSPVFCGESPARTPGKFDTYSAKTPFPASRNCSNTLLMACRKLLAPPSAATEKARPRQATRTGCMFRVYTLTETLPCSLRVGLTVISTS